MNGADSLCETLLPADAAWSEVPKEITRAAPAARKPVDPNLIRAAARALKSGRKTILMLSGAAPREMGSVRRVLQNRLRRPWYAGDVERHQPFAEGANHDQGRG